MKFQSAEETHDDDEHIDEDTANYEIRDQESNTGEELSEHENEEVGAGPWYSGKDGNTKWRETAPPKNGRIRIQYINSFTWSNFSI
jgi:hypothetical protein